MYRPEKFAADDDAAIAVIDDWPFAMLLTPHEGRVEVSHLPVIRIGDDLFGHLARANPQVAAMAGRESTLVFTGPHAYVSPHWYAEGAPSVPTWNYAAVHVRGIPRMLSDEETFELLETMTARFAPRPLPTLPEPVRRAKLGAIAGFSIPIEQMEAKFKMSQNRRAEDRAGVVAGLSASDQAMDLAVADWMDSHLDCRTRRDAD